MTAFLSHLTTLLSLISCLIIGGVLCAPQLHIRTNRRNETYVLFTGSAANFSESIKICRDQFAGSAIVRDRNDQDFFAGWIRELAITSDWSNKSSVQYTGTWLGATYINSAHGGGRVVWQSLQHSPQSSITFWAPREPTCWSSCCGVAMDDDGRWIVRPCEFASRVFCRAKIERQPPEVPPTPGIHPTAEEETINKLKQELDGIRQHVDAVEMQLADEKQARLNETERVASMIERMKEDFASSLEALEGKIRCPNKCP